jgi:hypothetical protein
MPYETKQLAAYYWQMSFLIHPTPPIAPHSTIELWVSHRKQAAPIVGTKTRQKNTSKLSSFY